MKKIKSVIFDEDGVLILSFNANLKFFQDLMIRTGYNPPTSEEYKGMFHMALLDTIKFLIKSDSQEKIDEIFQMASKRIVRYPTELLTSPDCMEETIKLLSKNYSLGIVTSRVKNGVFEPPTMKKIEKYFKVVISYEDTIKHKPDSEPLLLAVQKLGIKRSEAVYVGDAQTDILAAKSAGMKSILFPDSKIEGADASTNYFPEIINLIKQF